MSLIEGIAQRCFNFYGPADRFTPYSVLRVITLIEDIIINSESTIKQIDLKWQARGVVQDLMRRIRNRSAQGYYRLPDEQEELEAIEVLVDYFYEEVFKNDCGEQRAILRARRNLLNSGINAWYQVNWEQFRKEKK